MPVGAPNFREGIRMCVEIYQFLRILLKERNLSTAVGDEGGFASDLEDAHAVLELMTEAIQKVIWEKPVSHHFTSEEIETDECKLMSQIGG